MENGHLSALFRHFRLAKIADFQIFPDNYPVSRESCAETGSQATASTTIFCFMQFAAFLRSCFCRVSQPPMWPDGRAMVLK